MIADGAAREELGMPPVIDMHLHMTVYEEMRPWVQDYGDSNSNEDFTTFLQKYSKPEDYEELLEESGVDYGVVLADVSPITTGIASAEQVASFCHGSQKLIPFATVNPYLVTQPARAVERFLTELACKGLKLYPTYQHYYPNDPMMYPVYAKAEALKVPVMFHTGSSVFRGAKAKYGDPIFFDDLAVDFPDLRIIMAHSGRGCWYDRAFFLARLHQNVFMEISGLPPQRLLSYFPEFERNADKILYGSDWPGMPNIKRNIELIRSLPVSLKSKEKILGGNAAGMLGL